MNTIIDFHTHIFPDNVAKEAIPHLEKEGNVKAFLDGTEKSLLNSMDRNNISASVVCSIATKVDQFNSILNFSENIKSDRLIPFPSIHPADKDAVSRIKLIKDKGFSGIKMHPYYQDFFIDDDNMMPIYEELTKQNLILLMHTGFDIAFPEIRRADPTKIIKINNIYPDLKLVTSHFGAWDLWDEVKELMIGKPIYMDLSYALEFLSKEEARTMIDQHPSKYLLFATDSPWAGQKKSIELLKSLELNKSLEKKILGVNASELLVIM